MAALQGHAIIQTVPGGSVVSLETLIDHRESVDAADNVGTVSGFFSARSHDYAAVVADGVVLGLCGRAHVTALLAGRYGFALHSRAPISDHLIPDGVRVALDALLADVLTAALARTGSALHDDIVLVDEEGGLVGLVSTRRLVEAQSAIVRHQIAALDAQRAELTRANRQLAESLGQQRIMERQMIEREKAALIETLAGGVAHELNNRLMPVVGYAELLLDEVKAFDAPKLEDYCRTIHESAFDAARIIRQLLQLSQPIGGQRVPCDLRRVVEQSLAFVELRRREGAVRFDVQVPEQEVVVAADAGQLKQVLLNLLLNGLQAVGSVAGPALSVRLARHGNTAVLSIADNGEGIPPAVMPRIFDPFFTTKEPDIGTGLGLSVCRAIVHQHEGTLVAESDAGCGASFVMSLPLVSTSVPAARPSTRFQIPSRCRGCRVLVVEDQQAIATLVARTIRSRLDGIVDHVDDGAAAQAAIGTGTYDVILTDIRMPHLNGMELVEWLTAEHPELATRVVLMTGDGSSSKLNAWVTRAERPTLQKPFTSDQLLEVLCAVLEATAFVRR